MNELASRTAVVTGGAGPLGRVLCDALARAGARLVLVDQDRGMLEEAVGMLPPVPSGRHALIEANLLRPEEILSTVSAVESVGSCDILVHNAAFTGTSGLLGYAVPFEQQTDEAYELALRLNLVVPFSLTRHLLPLLRASGHGSVVNVGSIYGLVGPNMNLYAGTTMGNPAAYAASKGGLAQLTRYLASVLAPDVRVNMFAPGGIARGQDPVFVKRYETLTPLKRMASEEDFRGVVTWLASDQSSYVTGQVIAIDGGWTTW